MSKVLFYIDAFKNQGGAQRVMSNVMEHFLSIGSEIILVTDFVDKSDVYDRTLISKIKRVFLTENNEGNFVYKNIRKISGLRKLIKSERPDACVAFLAMPNIRLLLSTFALKVPCFVSIRSDPKAEYGKSRIARILINCLFGRAAGIVLQTEFVRSYFNKHMQKKCRVIYNPVNDSVYELSRSDEQKNIVTFGSLLKCKNQKMLIDAYAKCKDSFPDDDLYIYGAGDYREELEKHITGLKLNDRIHLPGNVSNVAEILCRSKMFVLTSDYEGMPNALMEAMATGTPSISTDCPSGGPKTLITNSSEGLLVECNDADGLAAAMVSLADESIRKKMSVATKNRAMVFKGEKILKEWEMFIFPSAEKEA